LYLNVLCFCYCNIQVFVMFSEVTKILQFAAQASHELVPPDVSVTFCSIHHVFKLVHIKLNDRHGVTVSQPVISVISFTLLRV
jgi:hypothetical protein